MTRTMTRTIGLTSQCSTCAHFRSPFSREDGNFDGGPFCDAFPDAIPDEVLSNLADHRQPIDGDHGIQWESNGEAFPDSAMPNGASPDAGKSLEAWEQDMRQALALDDPTTRDTVLQLLAKEQARDRLGRFAGGGTAAAQVKAEAMHDEATIRQAFGYRDEKTGMTAEVTGIRSTGPGSPTYVDIAIKDRDGNHAGEAVRTILPARQTTVRHDGMALQPGMQGQGFATRFNAHAEESYRAHGIERITVNANIDVGGYSHARAGYDFANDTARANALVHVAVQAHKYPQAVRDQVNALFRNHNVTPIELAMIGHTPGATTWPGKEMLLGSMWDGVKTL